ncbi:MAG: hypothetical protein WC150_00715 [Bacteroidia bacterium]
MFQHKPLLYVTILLLQSCLPDKDQPKPADVLPPYTQQGANTIGCLVDGRVLVPGFSMADKYFGWSAVDNDFTYYIHKDNERVYVGIWDGTVNDTGVYDLKFIRGKREVYYINTQIGGGDAINGQLHIKYWNKQKHIMAGTFYFDVLKGDSSIIKITEGRFDMIYN